MPLTIRRLLQNPTLNRSRPHILSMGDRLDDNVCGIHIAESADLAGLIEGGELILCSGLALNESVERATTFMNDIERSGACAVMFSFLTDAAGVKSAIRAAAASMSFPVILLDDRARFIEIIETFNELSRSTAAITGPEAVEEFLNSPVAEQLSVLDLLRTAAELFNTPLVLEDEFSVMIFQRGLGIEQMYQYGEARRTVQGQDSGSFDLAGEQWVQNPVIVAGRRVGRIVCPLWRESARFASVLDRLSHVLGHKLIGKHEELQLLRQDLMADVVAELRSGVAMTEKVALLRLHLFGMRETEELIPAVLCIPTPSDRDLDRNGLVRRLRLSFGRLSVPVIIRQGDGLESDAIGLLFCLPSAERSEIILNEAYKRAETECGELAWSMGVSETQQSLKKAAREGLLDAYRLARGALSMDERKSRYYRAHDLGFRWIIQPLARSAEGEAFVRDQLEPLKNEPELLEFLEAYLNATGNIARLSRSLHLSRPSIYARLRRVQEEFGLDMDSADTRTSLHLALALSRLLVV
ncbi:PucR family transcriptional regulator ligand-binding domain-containing protein [Glutamicibacter sp. NPDC087673]|uniref:helix-turn-helix domain-containing protein n=1 Tax=Glutamicibacter sp. NPDC087673 TaxID=3363997 RepID=UPI003821AF1E